MTLYKWHLSSNTVNMQMNLDSVFLKSNQSDPSSEVTIIYNVLYSQVEDTATTHRSRSTKDLTQKVAAYMWN